MPGCRIWRGRFPISRRRAFRRNWKLNMLRVRPLWDDRSMVGDLRPVKSMAEGRSADDAADNDDPGPADDDRQASHAAIETTAANSRKNRVETSIAKMMRRGSQEDQRRKRSAIEGRRTGCPHQFEEKGKKVSMIDNEAGSDHDLTRACHRSSYSPWWRSPSP